MHRLRTAKRGQRCCHHYTQAHMCHYQCEMQTDGVMWLRACNQQKQQTQQLTSATTKISNRAGSNACMVKCEYAAANSAVRCASQHATTAFKVEHRFCHRLKNTNFQHAIQASRPLVSALMPVVWCSNTKGSLLGHHFCPYLESLIFRTRR